MYRNIKRPFLKNLGIVAFLIGGALTLSLTGCGGGSATLPDSPAATTTDDVTRDARVPSWDNTRVLTPILQQLSYLSDTLAGRDVRSSTYPKVTVTKGDKTVTVTVDYGPTPITTVGGKHTISGSVSESVDLNTHTGSITLNSFTVDGDTVTGSISLANVNVTASVFSATLQFDLTSSKSGHLVGSITYSKTLQADTGYSIPTGLVTWTPNTGTPSKVGFDMITANPVRYHNFVPDGGKTTLSFTETNRIKPVQITEVITFSATSPITGQVTISINGAPPYTATLPNF